METNARYLSVGIFVLAIVASGFGFVWWLNNDAGLQTRKTYRVRFQDSVAGLQIGSAVQFDGIRVGEVTGLQLDRDDPRKVSASIDVASDTPIRADTKVGLSFQGLMGSAAVSLSGGSAKSPPAAPSPEAPAVLEADPEANVDLTQAARQTLRRVDAMLADNADAVKATMENLRDFSGALSRNSSRIDAIMAALERLAGGGPAEKPKPIYDLATPTSAAIAPPAPKGQLVIAAPTAVVALQTQRMLARSPDGEISQLGEAQWSDSLPNLVQAKLSQSLEAAGFLTGPASNEQTIASNDQLLIDLRDFAIATSPDPTAKIEFSAKLVDKDGRIVATRLFRASTLATGMDPARLVAAFDKAFEIAAKDLVVWTAQSM